MTGRDDHQVAAERSIMKVLEGKPKYLKMYYLSMQYPSMRTKRQYIRAALQYISFIHDELQVDISEPKNFNYDNVTEFLYSIQYKVVEGGRAPTSIAYQKLTWTCLNKFFEYLVSTHQIDENPMSAIKRPKGHDNVKRVYMKQADIRATLEYINEFDEEFKTRDLAMVITFLQTGMRVTALSEMDVDNIHFQVVSSDGKIHSTADIIGASIIIVDKRNEEFEKVVSATAAKYLYLWLIDRDLILTKNNISDQPAVFIGKKGERLSTRGIEFIMNRLMPKIDGKQVTPHALRRTYGTTLYQQTKDIYYVQQAMGHASPATTQAYIVEDGNDKRKAADIMDKVCFGIPYNKKGE